MSGKKKIIILVLVTVVLASAVLTGVLGANKKADFSKLFSIENNDKFNEKSDSNSFAAYLSSYNDKQNYQGDPVIINASQLNMALSQGVSFSEGLEGNNETVIKTEGKSSAVFNLTIPKSGFYEISIDYINTDEGLKAAQRQLLIDDKLPFDECYNFVFNRLFKDDPEKKYDDEGNQIRAEQIELRQWQSCTLSDKRGFYYSKFKFYLEEGTHSLTLKSESGALAVSHISLNPPENLITYNEYLKQNPSGYPKAESIKFEFEDIFSKSVTNIRPEWVNDPKASPEAITKIKYNTFGGTAWKEGGQTASWKFHVEKEGYYTFAVRYDVPKTGTTSYRKISIDGNVPFDLFYEYPFISNGGLTSQYLLDNENKPIKIFLTAGDHVLSMETKVGPVRKVVKKIEDAAGKMDTLYRNITLITASIRDKNGQIISDANRDYNLDKKIPDLLNDLNYIVNKLDSAAKNLLLLSQDEKPQDYSSLERASKMIRKMIANPELIPQMMNEYSNILISLNTSAASMMESPLYLDYGVLAPDEQRLSENKSSVSDKLMSSLKSLVYSFTEDYKKPGQNNDSLNVWVARGRDWGNIINQLTAGKFTSKSGIKVNINILPQLSDYMVLTSYSGGNSPDIAMGMGQGTPVEFAARNAVVNLSGFDGFNELVNQMVKGSVLPYEYKSGVYGLPETMDFQVLFYRTDIFDELKLKVPQTWEELYKLIPYLQENGMDFYYPSGPGGFAPLLYQYGGSFYNDDLSKSLLDTSESIAAFSEYIDLFNKYKVPLQADAFQRMRMGTIPLAVGGYDMFTRLTTAAPELNGKWAIAPFLGKEKEDGSVDRSAPAGSTAIIMLSSIENKNNGWEFIRWWLSKDTQAKFGTEIESLLGSGSRWNTSNIEAMKELNWEIRDLDVILEQWNYYKINPTVLGGYFTDRQLLTAWNRAALSGEAPRIVLEDAVRKINKELTRKQLEFK